MLKFQILEEVRHDDQKNQTFVDQREPNSMPPSINESSRVHKNGEANQMQESYDGTLPYS